MTMPSSGLESEEKRIIARLQEKLTKHQTANLLHESYYDGTFKPRFLGIGLPDIAKSLELVAGWPATTVDVLEERLDIIGWTDEYINDAYRTNALDVESSQVHLDALIYGISFVSVTAGAHGEPDPLIRGHDPKTTTGIFNPRTRRLDWALTRDVDDKGNVYECTLWGIDELVVARRENPHGPWTVVERIPHTFGRVPMVAFINRPRVGDRGGRSEITKAVRSYTDSAVRAMTSMDVNREFFSSPQRWAVGVTEEDFVDASGQKRTPWQTVAGRLWALPGADEDGTTPSLGQFDPISPGPYLEQITGLAQLLAAEAAIPASYLGFTTENPASADAIRQMEARLVKRAERRQRQFGHSWSEIGWLIQQASGRADVTDYPQVKWREASTPTLAATMDAMVKATEAKIVPESSSVVWDLLGFSPEDQKRMMAERSANRAAAAREALATGANHTAPDEQSLAAALRGEPTTDDTGGLIRDTA